MSQLHKEEFDRIKREHEQVVTLLKSLAKQSPQTAPVRKRQRPDLPAYDPFVLEAAVVSANNAYALLLIAKAEGFMRAYLDLRHVSVGEEPKLSTLIDKCRKEFNSTNPKIPISDEVTREVHVLRVQRNNYAHGYNSSVFPQAARIVVKLGRYFDNLP